MKTKRSHTHKRTNRKAVDGKGNENERRTFSLIIHEGKILIKIKTIDNVWVTKNKIIIAGYWGNWAKEPVLSATRIRALWVGDAVTNSNECGAKRDGFTQAKMTMAWKLQLNFALYSTGTERDIQPLNERHKLSIKWFHNILKWIFYLNFSYLVICSNKLNKQNVFLFGINLMFIKIKPFLMDTTQCKSSFCTLLRQIKKCETFLILNRTKDAKQCLAPVRVYIVQVDVTVIALSSTYWWTYNEIGLYWINRMNRMFWQITCFWRYYSICGTTFCLVLEWHHYAYLPTQSCKELCQNNSTLASYWDNWNKSETVADALIYS